MSRTETAAVPPNFECLRCGNCCTWEGCVRLSDEDIRQISAFLNLSENAFINQYTELAPDRSGLILLDHPARTHHCIFFESNPNRCVIQPVKPAQCTAFPHAWRFEHWETRCMGAVQALLHLNADTQQSPR